MIQIYVKPYWSSPCDTVKTGRNEIKSCRKVLDVTPEVSKKEIGLKERTEKMTKNIYPIFMWFISYVKI